MRALTSRIDRARRDVAVGIVLDLSSSTAERIYVCATAPPRTNRDGSARRIIDTEREAVALLLRSLARLGDTAGVYGFSGRPARRPGPQGQGLPRAAVDPDL